MSGAGLPPVGNTGATLTDSSVEPSVHWLSGTTNHETLRVLEVCTALTGSDVEVRPRGRLGYARQYVIGGLVVLADGQGPQAAAMGCHVEASGVVCEELGLSRLADLYRHLELRASRIDLAVDGCPFTPAKVWRAWITGKVRTQVKVSADALDDRQWRSGDWRRSATGDTAYLGSPRAQRMARVYDRRETGTRFELQTRDTAAAAIAADLLGGDLEVGFGRRLLGHVRAFVDFVGGSDPNVSRRPLLRWWAKFVRGVEASRVRLTGVRVDTFEAAQAWIEAAVAPTLAVYEERLGRRAMADLLEQGRHRWGVRHMRMATGVS